ncbi:MAG: hypothetical protein A3H45_15290 [Ignavibacteria bacterium RIFCSPLOWO2_02_FULL_55_14]|nr:MAG: hypothetical protein A3H45_15290 [Ignavibacteria bacterium RIFCSPLOWO2_02_FULL_55_14]
MIHQRHMIRQILLLCALVSSTMQAQFAEDVLRFSQFGLGVGARTLSLGGATTGRGDEYSALFGNPAGLAAIRDYEVSLGFSRNGVSNDVSFLGAKTKSQNNAMSIDNAGVVYPVPTTRGSLTFALGFGRMSNFTSSASFDGFNGRSSIVASSLAPTTDLYAMSYTDERAFLEANIPFKIWLADTTGTDGFLVPILTDSVQQSATVLEGGGTNHWSFGAGIDIAQDISMGVSLNFVSGTYSYDREFIESDSRDVYHSGYSFPYNFDRFTYTSTIESQLDGFNVLFGLMMRKQGRYKIGMTLRTPTSYEIKETFTNAGKSLFDDGFSLSASIANATSYKIQTPYVVSGGLTLYVFDWISVSGDAEYTDWTQMAFETENPDLLQENRYIKRAFRATTNLRGGVEVTFWDLGLVLRGGGAYLPSPYKGDPSSFDQLYMTGGIGINMDTNTVLNLAGALGQWKSFRDNYYDPIIPQPSSTSESLTNSKVTVTLSYRF